MKQVDINIAEAIIRSAVIDNHDEELRRLEGDTSPILLSDAHGKRMSRLFARAKAKRTAVRVWVVARKTATAAAFIIAALTSLLLFNPKVQATVTEVIVEFFAQFTSFRFNSSTEEAIGDVEWVLGWFPESFSETYREYEDGISRAGYTNPDGITIRFTATPSEGNQINVDNENANYSVKTEDSIEYHIFASNSEEAPSVILWVNRGYYFAIRAFCDVDTLEKIAYSVHEAGG